MSFNMEIEFLSGICLTIIISHAWEWFHLSVSLRLQTKTCWSLQEVLIDVCQPISGKFQDSMETRALRWRGDKIIWVWCWQKYLSVHRPPWKCRNLGCLIIDVKWGENNYPATCSTFWRHSYSNLDTTGIICQGRWEAENVSCVHYTVYKYFSMISDWSSCCHPAWWWSRYYPFPAGIGQALISKHCMLDCAGHWQWDLTQTSQMNNLLHCHHQP